MKVQTQAAQHIFEAEVYLNDLDPNAVRVELYADGPDGDGDESVGGAIDSAPIRQEMTRVQPPSGEPRRQIYRASVPATRLPTDYTARIVPYRADVAAPLAVDLILWQR